MGILNFLKKTKDTLSNEDIPSTEYLLTIQTEIKPLETKVVNLATASKEIKHDVNKKIETLEKLIASYYDLKSKCISLGPKYHDYFINMWEHCHNSQNEDFVYIDSYKAELKELQLNRETLIAEQELYKHVREGLEEKY